MQEHLSSPSLANPDVLAMRMVQCAHNRDGIPEIVVGVTFLLGSGISWSGFAFQGRTQAIFLLAFIGLFCALCGFSNSLIKHIRRRYLLPWVGYVQMRPSSKTATVLTAAIALVIAVSSLFLVRNVHIQNPQIWLLPMEGIMIGVFQFVVGRLPRFWITGSLTVCAGVALAFTNWSLEECLAAFFAFIGVVELLAGGITLLRLLQQRTEPGA